MRRLSQRAGAAVGGPGTVAGSASNVTPRQNLIMAGDVAGSTHNDEELLTAGEALLPGPAVHVASADVAPSSSSSAPLAVATGVGTASSGDIASEQEVRAGGDVAESSSDVEVIEPVAFEEALLSAPAADVMEVLGYRTDCALPIDRKAG